MESFDIADYYRNPVMILGDGTLGQMMEPVEFKAPQEAESSSQGLDHRLCAGRERNVINSFPGSGKPGEAQSKASGKIPAHEGT